MFRVDVRPCAHWLPGRFAQERAAAQASAARTPSPRRAMFVNVSGCAVPLGLATSALRSCGIGAAAAADIVPLLQVRPLSEHVTTRWTDDVLRHPGRSSRRQPRGFPIEALQCAIEAWGASSR